MASGFDRGSGVNEALQISGQYNKFDFLAWDKAIDMSSILSPTHPRTLYAQRAHDNTHRGERERTPQEIRAASLWEVGALNHSGAR